MASKTEITVEQSATHHVEQVLGHSAISEAKNASDEERTESIWKALKGNRKAVVWSMLISLSVIMEGYDGYLLGNFWGYPEFQKKYGRDFGGTLGYQISAPWQTGLNMASSVGALMGAFMNGYFASKFGYRWVMIVSMMFMNAFIFIVFFAPSIQVLLVGQICCGLAWGVFATIGPAYASEVCPTNLRGFLTTYVNMCWAIGQFIASGVLRGLINRHDEWAYRIPFAVQWAWPLPIMIVCWFAPESPWYLTRMGKLEQARMSIERLGVKSTEQINGQLAMMVHTTTIEAELEAGTSYLDCFRGVNLRRTEICCMAFMGQTLSGSSFAYSPTYFLTSAGMDPNYAYSINLGAGGVAFCGTVASWLLLPRIGRRTIFMWGEGSLAAVLLLIAILNTAVKGSTILWVEGGLCVFWLFIFSLTIGPIAYTIVSETSSLRLRPLTVCLARNAYVLTGIPAGIIQSYFVNPTAVNASGKTGYLWAGTALLTFIWAFYRLPEAKGRTYEDLDLLFAQHVPARLFSSTVIDPYAQTSEEASFGK